MKEKFRYKKYEKKNIKVKINEPTEPLEYWETTVADLFEAIDKVLEYYDSIGVKLTNRQLYYQLVGKDLIPNKMKVYTKICDFLTDKRYEGKIDWDILEDLGRKPTKHGEWDGVKDIVESAVQSYRLPRWKDQEYYVEMFCEKEAGTSVLKPIADKFHCYFGANKGYASAVAMYDLAQRLKEQIENGKKTVILYFGDFDSSGVDMLRDIRERVTEFLTEGDDPIELENEQGEDMFQVVSVALTLAQVKKYKLPPNPAKQTDPRAKWYVAKYGDKSWELDAIDVLELRKIAEAGILDYIDLDKYNAWIEKENEHKEKLRDFAEELDEE